MFIGQGQPGIGFHSSAVSKMLGILLTAEKSLRTFVAINISPLCGVVEFESDMRMTSEARPRRSKQTKRCGLAERHRVG